MISYTTVHGVSVESEIKEIDLVLMSYVIDFYILSFLKIHVVLKDGDLCPTERDILEALRGTKIIWKKKLRKNPFKKNLDPELKLKKNKLYVKWPGNVTRSELYHGFHHILRQKLLKKDLDVKHTDKVWWSLAKKFKQDLEDKIKAEYNMMISSMGQPDSCKI